MADSTKGEGEAVSASLLERALLRVPLPYLVTAGVIAFLAGTGGFLLGRTIDTGDVGRGVADAWDSLVALMGSPDAWRIALFLAVTFAFYVYLVHMPRFMRLRLERAESAVAPLLPDGAQTYRHAFGPFSAPWPPLLLGVAMAAYDAVWGTTNSFPFAPGPAQTAIIVVASLFFYWAVGTGLWTYFGSVWALYRLGKEPLQLRPYHEDPMLGLRPLGGLSLSLSTVYFSAIGLVAAQTVVVSHEARPSLLALLSILAIVGIGMVYLPLYDIHRRMTEVKAREQEAARARFVRILDARDVHADESGDTLEAVRGILADMRHTLAQEAIERKVAAVPTWPFDTRVVARVAAVASSILVAVLIKVVIDYVLRI